MRKSFLIARSNIRKAKGQAAAILILMLIAALMLNLWLMLSMDYKANFERYHDKFNAEHVTLSIDGSTDELHRFLLQTLENDSRTADYRLDNCMHMIGMFAYNGGGCHSWFVFMDKDTALNRSIGEIEIIEEGMYSSGVYLPMLYKTEDIAVGKPIEISIGSHKEIYTVCGFFNSIMMGSHNCTLTEIVLTKDKYTELQNSGYAPQTTLCSIRLTDKSESLNYEASLKSAVSENYPNITIVSNCYGTVSVSRYIAQMICSEIMAAMAFFILLIALVVIISNILNYIQVYMKNLGVLKSVGYTSGQLIHSLLLQFLGLTFIAASIGIGLSYLLFPAVNAMMIAQTGIPYAMHFLPVPFALTLAVLGGTVALAVWFASHRVKRIEPVAALRSGIQTHNFKHNHVPLEKTKVPLNLALALKTTFSSVKHNITVCVTILVLSLVVVFSGLMTENVIVDITPFLNLIAGETADSCIRIQGDAERDFIAKMQADSRVENVYLYTSLNVSHTGGVELLANICEDFGSVNNQHSLFEGRFPKYDNEIAVAAKYADENGLKIGDEIEITANGKQEKYLICGFTQISNNLGKDCLLTRAGYERLGMLTSPSYYINLTSETDIDAFNLEIKEVFGDSVNSTINFLTTIEGTAGFYVKLMTIIVVAILVLSVIIIAFVLYLLVRTMLNNKLHDYGIMKALGFTTKQLILQTALSFMPATIVSTAAGLTLSSIIINPLTSLFLSSVGIVKCTFAIPVGFIAVAGTGLVLYAFLTVCLLSLKIRKISPRALLTGE
ncbi:MAG: FtsX-like permease family protein [Lachnospiraceae bacterium]|nr:FtsX-like permease family protein [Lachnospiraceae bacterium]